MRHDFCQTVGSGHGRIEIRRCWTNDDPEQLSSWILEVIGLGFGASVWSRRNDVKGAKCRWKRYYICLESDAQRLQAIRSHWGIENRVHWVLDVSFREDESRVRTGNAPENLAIVRHMANLLRQDRTSKASNKAKRKLAGWDNDYLLSILSNRMRLPWYRTGPFHSPVVAEA